MTIGYGREPDGPRKEYRMRWTWSKGTIEKTKENKDWFNRPGYEMTGETLRGEYTNGATEFVVFKGSWTRSGTVRDCGDHYIYAGYSSYTRIDKETLQETDDVEDR